MTFERCHAIIGKALQHQKDHPPPRSHPRHRRPYRPWQDHPREGADGQREDFQKLVKDLEEKK